MRWTDHIDINTCTREELIKFLKEREQLAWERYRRYEAQNATASYTKALKDEWWGINNLLYALNI